MKKTVLIIPPNDAEAILIHAIAASFNIPLILSKQGHGASLDKEKNIVDRVREEGYTRAVIVELPGPRTEKLLKEHKVKVEIIDHHQYGDLDRAHDKKGKQLPSSLEQFLTKFKITRKQLAAKGFDPFFVDGIAVLDRGFVWELLKEGYSWEEIEQVLGYRDKLMRTIQDPAKEKQKNKVAESAWKKRKKWNEYLIVEARSKASMRNRVSRLLAMELKKPHPLIMLEPMRGFIYVQECKKAKTLLKEFGGFMFGTGGNWGYLNEKGKPKVDLKDVKRVLKPSASKAKTSAKRKTKKKG